MRKQNRQLNKWTRDPGLGTIAAVGLLLVVIKLVLASAQQVYLSPPSEAGLDDMLMYNGAVSITNGEWLGVYDWTTLSKYRFFSLWLAGLHALGVPYLLGGQLLWAAAACAAAVAFAPLFKNRWVKLLLFAVLLFNPASTANPAPFGYMTRVYRDNIFPALCLLCVAGMAGFALRLSKPVRLLMGWAALAGVAFAAAWLCREDGWWMAAFVLGAAAVVVVFIIKSKEKAAHKVRQIAALALVFVLLAAGLLGWAAQNNAVYGEFVISDFSSGAFADAYGAMTRVKHEQWNPQVDVPRDVREKLYVAVPQFAPLRPLLESETYLGRFAGWTEDNPDADYSSGAFYWALRKAAWEQGCYESPQASRAYFAQLAEQINRLCDNGSLPAERGRRSSVSPPVRAEYVPAVLAEGLYSVGYCAVFAGCSAGSLWSPYSNDPAYYEAELVPIENYLHDKALTATKAGSEEPYHSPLQRLCFGVLALVRIFYAVLCPLALLAAVAWLVLAVLKKRSEINWMSWFLCLGLLLCILLRAAMIAFVTVSSFKIGTYVMYLASIHPLMLLLAFTGTAQLIEWRKSARKAVA